MNVNKCQQVRRSESQVLSGFVFLKLKFYEVLILGFIRFYSLLKQSAKLTFTNSMTAQNCVHLHARVVVPKHEFSVVDQRKIALAKSMF